MPEYKYPETEDLRPNQTRYRLFAIDVSSMCHFRPEDLPAGAVKVSVEEIIAMDARSPVARYCSAQLQQCGYLLRHEIVCLDAEGLEVDDDEAREWADEQATELDGDLHEGSGTHNLYGGHTFDETPFVDVVVEIDEDDLADYLPVKPGDFRLDRAWFDVLQEHESGSPTMVPRTWPAPTPTPEGETHAK